MQGGLNEKGARKGERERERERKGKGERRGRAKLATTVDECIFLSLSLTARVKAVHD